MRGGWIRRLHLWRLHLRSLKFCPLLKKKDIRTPPVTEAAFHDRVEGMSHHSCLITQTDTETTDYQLTVTPVLQVQHDPGYKSVSITSPFFDPTFCGPSLHCSFMTSSHLGTPHDFGQRSNIWPWIRYISLIKVYFLNSSPPSLLRLFEEWQHTCGCGAIVCFFWWKLLKPFSLQYSWNAESQSSQEN